MFKFQHVILGLLSLGIVIITFVAGYKSGKLDSGIIVLESNCTSTIECYREINGEN